MHSLLPAGFHLRKAAMDDLTLVVAMLQVSEMAEHGRVITTEHDLRMRWEMPGYDIAQHAGLIVASNGQFAAVIRVLHSGSGRMYANLRVHPDYATLGLHDILIELGVDLARELVAEALAGARATLNISCAKKNAEFYRALEQANFKQVRSDWTMQIDIDEPPPEPI